MDRHSHRLPEENLHALGQLPLICSLRCRLCVIQLNRLSPLAQKVWPGVAPASSMAQGDHGLELPGVRGAEEEQGSSRVHAQRETGAGEGRGLLEELSSLVLVGNYT